MAEPSYPAPSSASPVLLIEVFEAVIDHASDDPASLRELSLTCAAFLPRSRLHLFSSIIIRTVEQMASSRDFLDARPWLCDLVRDVALFFAVPKGNSKRNVRVLDVVPVHLLIRLPNLRAWRMQIDCVPDLDIDKTPSLSLHRCALSCYRKYGHHMQNLTLYGITFNGMSDFTRLVSAFTNIRSLACDGISFRMVKELANSESSLSDLGTSILARPPQMSTLRVTSSVDMKAVEYLLFGSRTVLENLILLIRHHYDNKFERLAKSTTWLSRLSSLTLDIFLHVHDFEYFSSVTRTAAEILESIERAHLTAVEVGFRADPIAQLGSCLSGPDAPLEACKQLEDALLTFPNSRIVVHDVVNVRREGRADFWTPTIERAFPGLAERELLIFDSTRTKPKTPDPPGHEMFVTALVTSHDSTRIVTASYDGTIIVWDTSSGAVLQEWVAYHGCINDLALSPDSRHLVSASDRSESLVIWAIDNGRVQPESITELEGHTDGVISCAWSLDGGLIATSDSGGTVRIWNGHTFQQCDGLHDHWHKGSDNLQFSPDGRYLAWTSNNGCYIWTTGTGEQPRRLPSHPDCDDVRTNTLSFDLESGRIIATAHENYAEDPGTCVVRIWDVATGAELAVLVGHSRGVINISFSPDGRSLVSTSRDGSVRIWDAESGEQMVSLEAAESGTIWSACFLPDGKYIATGSDEGWVRLWRAGDGSGVADVAKHVGSVDHLAFSPNGEFLASGCGKGTVRISRLSTFVGQ